jgi:uncharacterized protein YndB with AHSA1/START domain
MTVKEVHKDPEKFTLTFTVELDAPVERAWQLWSDPRQLERWWGPPMWPATFVDHDFSPGGRVTYYMTGPDGEKSRGWWEFTAIDAPNRLEFRDGFADENFAPTDFLPPTSAVVTLAAGGPGTIMTIASQFPSLEVMEKYVSMGMEEGMGLALGQMDAILAG